MNQYPQAQCTGCSCSLTITTTDNSTKTASYSGSTITVADTPKSRTYDYCVTAGPPTFTYEETTTPTPLEAGIYTLQ
jgi:hypothetical protein